jgi:hypothetical protein
MHRPLLPRGLGIRTAGRAHLGEGNISGTVEIKRGGSTRSLLTSSGVFKTKQQLATHLKSRALDWVSRPCNTGNDERASPAAPEPALR